ncbi:hypothetical protein [Streptomyces sp. NPDC048825]|uniref:hypothetical protein n=1 Tax=Streptomyces sp. NPDC048825 TaxID=3365592 RepID=UPI003721D860
MNNDDLLSRNADIRGDVASMVITRSGDAAYCLAGSDSKGVAMGVSPVGARLAAQRQWLAARGS